jgi:hypothetical protein
VIVATGSDLAVYGCNELQAILAQTPPHLIPLILSRETGESLCAATQSEPGAMKAGEILGRFGECIETLVPQRSAYPSSIQ